MLEAHGMEVEMNRQNSHTLRLHLRIFGDIAYDDFREMEQRLEQELAAMDKPRILALIDLTGFNGWEARAFWEDIRFTRKHGDEFSKLAIVGCNLKEKIMATLVDWFMLGSEVKYFESLTEAEAWLDDKAA
ncbi:SpoIIAA family protein [Oceanimonas marisflavi]|uniref:STAS/SEC14 domain-containing protein n=1 Tax=Oceanimonas marisflavi TaxID=2059724 RepID=UPI000D310E67|nr:STAS/SEC14 domain-containing protein [Oceanimonas marisflavi]